MAGYAKTPNLKSYIGYQHFYVKTFVYFPWSSVHGAMRRLKDLDVGLKVLIQKRY